MSYILKSGDENGFYIDQRTRDVSRYGQRICRTGGADGFDLVGALAKALNADVGASRVPVDEKWVPHHMEIGQTGKIVSPDLYVAVGISGATQHVTGILGSGKIVAINKDPDANIFRVSDYGLVADYKQALPILIERLK